MEYRQLGDTEVRLPEIGFGTWAYRGGVEPIRRSVQLGGFHIDTAEAYGTEDVVGEAIKDIRDKVFLATKVSPSHFRHDALIRAAENSLGRLRTDHIDLYQLHSPNASIPIEETMAAMEELVDAGKVRFIGVSNFSVAQMKEAQASMSKYKIVSNQVRYSLVVRGIESELLPYCQEDRITVIAYSPLARGMYALRARDRHGALAKVAQTTGGTEAQVALNWCVRKDPVVAIPKTDSVERVGENCGSSGWRLSEEQIRMLEDSFG